MIDVEIFYKLSRGVFPPNADIYTIGFSTHKLKPLLSSGVFPLQPNLYKLIAEAQLGMKFQMFKVGERLLEMLPEPWKLGRSIESFTAHVQLVMIP
jgi:hypothetical protein